MVATPPAQHLRTCKQAEPVAFLPWPGPTKTSVFCLMLQTRCPLLPTAGAG
jgi:hypothetical protein